MNSWRLVISFFCAVFAITLCSCSRTPDGVLDEEDMAELLVDVHKGEGVVESNPSAFPTDSAKRAFRQAIYARHGLTTEQVDKSLRWYGYNMEKYVDVYDLVLEKLDEDMRLAQERAGASGTAATGLNGTGSLALEGDSVDVWIGLRFRPFAQSLESNVIPFLLKFDQNWEQGDIYTFRSKMQGNSREGRLIVGIDYTDGSSDTYSSRLIGDGWHETKFALDSTRTAREIYGALQYDASAGEVAFVDSISLTRTRWKQGVAIGREGVTSIKPKRHSNIID